MKERHLIFVPNQREPWWVCTLEHCWRVRVNAYLSNVCISLQFRLMSHSDSEEIDNFGDKEEEIDNDAENDAEIDETDAEGELEADTDALDEVSVTVHGSSYL